MTKQTLVNKIKADSITALKNGDKTTVNSLRRLIANLELEKVKFKLAEVSGLTQEQTETVISREVKKINNAMEDYKKVGKSTDSHEKERALLLTYLPQQMTEDEIRKKITFAKVLLEHGQIKNVMQYLSAELKGKADMKQVAKIAKEMS